MPGQHEHSSLAARRRGRAAQVPAPADHRGVGLHSARVRPPSADGSEGTAPRRGLAVGAVPADHRAVGLHAACVRPVPSADGSEGTARRRGLADTILAPADHRAVGLHAACVRPARGRGHAPPPTLTEAKEPPGGVAWPTLLSPQQTTEPSVFTPHVCSCPALTEEKGMEGCSVAAGTVVACGAVVAAGADVATGAAGASVAAGTAVASFPQATIINVSPTNRA